MEKIIYLISAQNPQNQDDFVNKMRQEIVPLLLAENPLSLKLNVADNTVAQGAGMAMESIAPKTDVIVEIWLNTAISRKPIEEILLSTGATVAGYLVSESCPLVNTTHTASIGDRTPGFTQIALLQQPARLSFQQWIDIWQNSHTQVALSTQSTFAYTQNLVVRPLTADAPSIDAIVTEIFPLEALTDSAVFYDAINDEAKQKKNSQAMMESCARFIDFDKINVCPTSEYIYKVTH